MTAPDRSLRQAKSERPAVALARRIMVMRKRRRAHLPWVPFNEPAWDMLLDLFVAHIDGKQPSVSSLCYASRVPETTALRWITELVESGRILRWPDPHDRRRSLVALSVETLAEVEAYLRDVVRFERES